MSVKQKFWKGLFVAGGAGVAALAAVNASIARGVAAEPEDASLGGEARAFASAYGSVYYRAAGAEGREPLLFLHDIGAGASSFMWRKNFDALATDFRVYAPDFLGFGLSDKPAHAPYSADLYVALIRDFLGEEARRAPAHLVAGGLSAAFAVRVADEHPALVSSLTFTTNASPPNDSSRTTMRRAISPARSTPSRPSSPATSTPIPAKPSRDSCNPSRSSGAEKTCPRPSHRPTRSAASTRAHASKFSTIAA
jgi:pimeloyl-ACP methyl ester carboxylesterase